MSVQSWPGRPRQSKTYSPPQAYKAPALKAQAAAIPALIVRTAGATNGVRNRGNSYGQAEPLPAGGNDLVLVARSSLPQYCTPSVSPVLCRPAEDGVNSAADARLMMEAGPTSKHT